MAAGLAIASDGTGTVATSQTSSDDGRDVGAADDRLLVEVPADREPEPARQAASPGTTPAGPSQGQFSGVVLALVVLAIIGAAVWGVRPAVLDRFASSPRWREWTPGGAGGIDTDPGARGEGELLTDEEQIIKLLKKNDGRLKQQHVVETQDWSKAKVSRLLSSMEDDDAIVRIQLGREKLIFLSGHEPSSARSALHGDQ